MDHYAEAGELDLRPAVLVLPGARAGRRLMEVLLDAADARGLRFTPPAHIVSTGQLPELLYEPERPLVEPAVARQVYGAALRGTDSRHLAEVFHDLPDTPAGWIALARLVHQLHSTLGAEGMTFADVASTFSPASPWNDAPRWTVLGRVQREYWRVLEAAGGADRDGARMAALARGTVRSPGDVWLVGVAELPRVTRRLLMALTEAPRALVHAPEALADRFDDLGCVIPAAWAEAEIPLEDDAVVVVDGPAEQARAVVDAIREVSGGVSPADVVVGVPDAELARYLEQALAAAEVPHRSSVGRPMAETEPVRLLAALADHLESPRYESLAALVRHPDLFSGDFLVDGRTPAEVTDDYFSRHLPSMVDRRSIASSTSGERMDRVVAEVGVRVGTEALTGARRLSEWMPAVVEVLVRVYGAREMDRGSLRDRRILSVLAKVRDCATAFAGLPAPADPEMGAAEAIRRMVSEVGAEVLAPDPDRDVVELLGWLELPPDDAPVAVVAGFNHPHVPETVGGDPFLPGGLRAALGIPDDAARFARDAYLLSALVSSRKGMRVVAGRRSAAGDPLRPSRLLFAAPAEVAARRVVRFLGGEDGGETGGRAGGPAGAEGAAASGEARADSRSPTHGGSTASGPGASAGEAPGPTEPGVLSGDSASAFALPPHPVLRIDDLPDTLRVSDFALLLTDPYGFALERLLGLEAVGDDAREMDPLLFGTVAHDVLEAFADTDEAASSEAAAVRGALDSLLDQRVSARFGSRPIPAVRLQVEHLRRRLHAFADWQAAWAGEGWRIAAVEADTGEVGHPFEVDGKVVRIKGRIDRIDHNIVTGEWALFDYKTSENKQEPDKAHRRGPRGARTWVNLQLPLYRLLLPGVRDRNGDVVVPESHRDGVRLGYILLPGKAEESGGVLAEWTPAEVEEAWEAAREAVRTLRAGVFTFDPSAARTAGGRWADPFDALLGRKALPLVGDDDGDDGEGGAG